MEILTTIDSYIPMKRVSPNWKTWLKNGDQYMDAATPKGEKSRFGEDIRYNLLSLSLEGYSMAILDYHRTLPENHTYTDLINALDGVVLIPERLKKQILKFENIQSICSVEKYYRTSPSEKDLKELKKAVSEIADIAHDVCCKAVL